MWSKLLKDKYMFRSIYYYSTWLANSKLWKDIIRTFPQICSMGDGNDINAWHDWWIESGIDIENWNLQIPIGFLNAKLNNLVGSKKDWNWQLLPEWMLKNLIHKIKTCLPPSIENGNDKLIMTGTNKNWLQSVTCTIWWWCKRKMTEAKFGEKYESLKLKKKKVLCECLDMIDY